MSARHASLQVAIAPDKRFLVFEATLVTRPARSA